LDMVAEVAPHGDLLGAWDVLGQPLWARFSRTLDYRKISTTKPHLSHPNYVFEAGDSLFVTRFEQKDAVSLGDQRRRIQAESGFHHDGSVFGEKVYFTSVNGCVASVDWRSGESHIVDLNMIIKPPHGRPLGWCRGLKVYSDSRLVVGFSRLRQ